MYSLHYMSTFVYFCMHKCTLLCRSLYTSLCILLPFCILCTTPWRKTTSDHFMKTCHNFFPPRNNHKRESPTDFVRLKLLPAVTITLCYTENCIINMLLLTAVSSFIINWSQCFKDYLGSVVWWDWMSDQTRTGGAWEVLWVCCLFKVWKIWNKMSNGDVSWLEPRWAKWFNPTECPNLCGKLIMSRSERKKLSIGLVSRQTYTHEALNCLGMHYSALKYAKASSIYICRSHRGPLLSTAFNQ